MACGTKLVLILVVLQSDWRGNRCWFVGSLVMVVALFQQRDGVQVLDGWADLVIFSALLTTLCRAFWSAAGQLRSRRLRVLLLRVPSVVRADGWRSWLCLLDYGGGVGGSCQVTPRNLLLFTDSTALPLMVSGVCDECYLSCLVEDY